MGLVAAVAPGDIVDSFTTGFGSTTGSVGLLVALGAMIGGLLTASGGADRVVTAIVGRVGPRALPWAMGGVAALIAIPLFFEIGVVLLVPIVLLVARRSEQPVLRVGIPALAGLSVLHGFIPPHPGPLAAIASLKADLGLTLLLGLVLAVPSVIIAGPLLGGVLSRRLSVAHPQFALAGAAAPRISARRPRWTTPGVPAVSPRSRRRSSPCSCRCCSCWSRPSATSPWTSPTACAAPSTCSATRRSPCSSG
jgi:GntP family gluconate:H+ symporter